VYATVVETTRPPNVSTLAARLGVSGEDVRGAYGRLAARRVLVVASDGETILMAPPFSGVRTQHRVHVGARAYHANCSWDALGIAAALQADAEVRSRCEQSGEPLRIPIGPSGPATVDCVAHFAVPAARWWDDIVYT